MIKTLQEQLGQEREERKFSRRREYFGFGQEAIICGSRGVLMECETLKHQFFKVLYCGREWCSGCGEDNSNMHKRRYYRLMPRVFYLGELGKKHGLGYFVFTIPDYIRDKFKNKSRLQGAGRFVRGLLRWHGFDIGLSRWHFFGDGEITESDRLDLGEYHPHINCLVVGRFIPDKELASIKLAWKTYLEKVSGESIEVVNVWYRYYQEKSKWFHKGVYITRSTFKSLDGHSELAERLFDFRNVCYWGWGRGEAREERMKRGRVALGLWFQDMKDAEVKKEYEDLTSVTHLRSCPICFSEGSVNIPIYLAMNLNTGGRVIIERDSIEHRIEKDLGAGFYQLSNVMFNIKPMSEEVEEEDEVYEEYDTS